MGSTRGLAVLFVGAAAVQLAGVVFGSSSAVGAGAVAAAGVLAVHAAAAGHAPRNVRMLLVAGLIFLAAAVVTDVWDWPPADLPILGALAAEQAAQTHVIWVAAWQVLGIGSLVAATVCLPPDDRRGLPLALGVIGAPTLLVLLLATVVFAILESNGSFTDMLIAVLVAGGAIGWLTLRMRRRFGGRIPAAGIALTLGLTVLTFPLWWAVTSAMRAVTDTGCPQGTICMTAVMVAEPSYVDTAADAAVAAVVLGGTALIVLGCAGVGTRRSAD